MATTSLWRIKGSIGDVIRYAENEKKTTKEILPEEKAREKPGGFSDCTDDTQYADSLSKNRKNESVFGVAAFRHVL